MSEEKKEPTEWCGKDGTLVYKGVKYCLPEQSAEDLKMLNLSIGNDNEAVRSMLKWVDLGEFREDAKRLLSIHKKQLTAINMEFLRRKKEIKPLESFAFSAIYEMYGPECLEAVKATAMELQAKEYEAKHPLDERTGIGIPRFAYSEDRMCGPLERRKVKHPTKQSAEAHLTEMRERGYNTRGMTTYGPCPYCGNYHVGHKPKKIWDRARMELDGHDVCSPGVQLPPVGAVEAGPSSQAPDPAGDGDEGHQGTG